MHFPTPLSQSHIFTGQLSRQGGKFGNLECNFTFGVELRGTGADITRRPRVTAKVFHSLIEEIIFQNFLSSSCSTAGRVD